MSAVAIPTLTVDVASAEGLSPVADALGRAQDFAVDVEADAMHAFRARLCFVQLSTDDGIWLLDTLSQGVRLDPLAARFADPAVRKYFHAAGGDLQYLAEAGVRVAGLFDTHRAATLLGWPKVGLADLVLQHLGVVLKKEHQQSDFSLRPLPDGMRDYIADDVRYLVEIGRLVREACRAKDILEEVELDCDRMAADAKAWPDLTLDFTPKLQRQGKSATELQLAEALSWSLHRERLKWAEAANVPFGKMLSNAAVSAIASAPPSTLKDLARREGVRGAFVREHGEAVLAMVRDHVQRARDGALPPVAAVAPRDPKKKKREEALLDWRKAAATARGVTGSAVLSNALVAELSSQPPASLEALAQVPYFGPKRLQLYGDALLKLLQSV